MFLKTGIGVMPSLSHGFPVYAYSTYHSVKKKKIGRN